MALLSRVKSKSFLRSSCQGLSEYVVGSSGIQFFTRLDLGEQWLEHICNSNHSLNEILIEKYLLAFLSIHFEPTSFQIQELEWAYLEWSFQEEILPQLLDPIFELVIVEEFQYLQAFRVDFVVEIRSIEEKAKYLIKCFTQSSTSK